MEPTSAKYTTAFESQTLAKFAGSAKLGIVEIGCLDGETTNVIARASAVPVYGIDPIVPDSMNPGLIGSKEKILQNLKWCKRFKFIQEYSHIAVASFNYDFDLIFIDGDHSYDAVKKDVDDWWSKLATSGIMLMHDTAPVTSENATFKGHDGPIRVTNEIKKTKRCIGVWDTITGFQK
jgi:predicted O-methyltransferase YrrM